MNWVREDLELHAHLKYIPLVRYDSCRGLPCQRLCENQPLAGSKTDAHLTCCPAAAEVGLQPDGYFILQSKAN